MCHASALRMGREGVETAASPVLAEVALIYRAAGACPRAPCRPRSAKDRPISWPLRALLFVTPPLALEQRLLVLLPHRVRSARVLPPAGRRGCVQEGSPSRRPLHSLAQAPRSDSGRSVRTPSKAHLDAHWGLPALSHAHARPGLPEFPARTALLAATLWAPAVWCSWPYQS